MDGAIANCPSSSGLPCGGGGGGGGVGRIRLRTDMLMNDGGVVTPVAVR
jgi:hypothetical protein